MKTKLYLYMLLLMSAMFCFAGCNKIASTGALAQNISEEGEDNFKIAFSQTDYFYKENVELKIQSNKPCKIYYTMNGKEPDETQSLYKEPILLVANESENTYCIKAKGYYKDGTETETIVHTYFTGKNIEKRFDMLVFSVTTDPYNLYDDVYGIFIEGKIRRDYIKANPKDKIEPNDPANYNMRGRESERKVYLEILEPDGTKITEQAAGIRAYGGWSRANKQKSIKIFARKEYDEDKNKLRYEFFPSKTAASGNGTKLDTFKELVLRNSGNDNGSAYIRDELFQTLASQAGYLDYEAVRPAVLYINGKNCGFYWMHEVYCDEYFEDNYGKYNGNFEILEGGENFKNLDVDGENANSIKDYEAMYSYSTMDLTKDSNYKKLCELIDVENYLSYYALQVYIGNEDWPHNNYKTYRYYTTKGEEYREAPFDGKWRYLLHDLDFGFGIYGSGPQTDNLGNMIGKSGQIKEASPLFGQLMRRADCKEIFVKKSLDLINGAFAPNNLNKVLEEMNASRWKELSKSVSEGHMNDKLNYIQSYGSQRAGNILLKYKEYFNLGKRYLLIVQPPKDGKVQINSYQTADYFKGSYFVDYNTVITAVIPEGKEFDYWLLNGKKVTKKELVISPKKILKGKAEVTCVVK